MASDRGIRLAYAHQNGVYALEGVTDGTGHRFGDGLDKAESGAPGDHRVHQLVHPGIVYRQGRIVGGPGGGQRQPELDVDLEALSEAGLLRKQAVVCKEGQVENAQSIFHRRLRGSSNFMGYRELLDFAGARAILRAGGLLASGRVGAVNRDEGLPNLQGCMVRTILKEDSAMSEIRGAAQQIQGAQAVSPDSQQQQMREAREQRAERRAEQQAEAAEQREMSADERREARAASAESQQAGREERATQAQEAQREEAAENQQRTPAETRQEGRGEVVDTLA